MNRSDTWVVLVAGEHHTVSKTLGGHASITSIGDAFDILRCYLPRERIIVIAQVDECRQWHDQAFEEKVKDVKDPESAERQRPMWEEKKKSFWKHLGGLIREGGADYDGAMVNPDTVLHIILGERSENYPRVIQYEEGRTKVFFSLFGHGSWSGRNENHYFYLPYPSDPILQSLSRTPRPPLPRSTTPDISIEDVLNGGPDALDNETVLNPADGAVQGGADNVVIADQISDTSAPLIHCVDVELQAASNTASSKSIPLCAETESSRGSLSPSPPLNPLLADSVAQNSNMGNQTIDPKAALVGCGSNCGETSLSRLVDEVELSGDLKQDSTGVVVNDCGLASVGSAALEAAAAVDAQDTPQSGLTASIPLRQYIDVPPQCDLTPSDVAETDSETLPEAPPDVPIECVGLQDPLYLCINSCLSLKGGEHRPFRIHISPIPKPGKPPKSKEQMDSSDSSVLHWQFLFHALREIFSTRSPKGIFIFQQSCGSGGMWLWLKENQAYEDEFGCSKWPLFVGYTAESETSAVGASWGVFFGLLAAVLGKQRGKVEEAPGEGEEVKAEQHKPSAAIEDNVAQSLSPAFATASADPDPVSVSGPTLRGFYSAVMQQYYRVEPFVHHVNFELSEGDRAKESFTRFGVLGTAHGAGGGLADMDVRDFFL